jgi:hypothetical protein
MPIAKLHTDRDILGEITSATRQESQGCKAALRKNEWENFLAWLDATDRRWNWCVLLGITQVGWYYVDAVDHARRASPVCDPYRQGLAIRL